MAFPPDRSAALSAPSDPSTPPPVDEEAGEPSTAVCPACGAKVKLEMAEPAPSEMPVMPGGA